MSLHILKLCVGVETISDLVGWVEEQRALCHRLGQPEETRHTTRMVPKRIDEIVDGGSLYWVIKGQISCRQQFLDIRPFTDRDGIGRCHLVMEPVVHPVEPRPFRPFQGWRYLKDGEKPRDIGTVGEGVGDMPEALRHELAGLGLL